MLGLQNLSRDGFEGVEVCESLCGEVDGVAGGHLGNSY
jgi:hypothetical protein